VGRHVASGGRGGGRRHPERAECPSAAPT
jgi:hypothetical protein